MTVIQRPKPLSDADRASTRQALSGLRDGADLIVAGRHGATPLPAAVARDVMALLEAYDQGGSPIVASTDEMIGTQQAADLLNLSRPTVVRLMNQGRIPFDRPGRHRRVRLSDLLAFKATLQRERAQALQQLSDLGQLALRHAAESGALSDEMI